MMIFRMFLLLCVLFSGSCSVNYVYVISGDENSMPISQTTTKRLSSSEFMRTTPPGQDQTPDNSTIAKSKDAIDRILKRPAIYILIDQHRTVSPSTAVDIPVSAIPGL